MLFLESRHAKRLVGRFDYGEDLIASLRLLAEREVIRTAWVRGMGRLDWAEFIHYDAEGQRYSKPRIFDGPLDLVQFSGNISIRHDSPVVQAFAQVSAPQWAGYSAVGGELVSASVIAVDFTIEVYEDLRLIREEDERTGLAIWKGETVPGTMARRDRTDSDSAVSKRPPSPTRSFDSRIASASAKPSAEDRADVPTKKHPITGRPEELAAPETPTAKAVTWQNIANLAESSPKAEGERQIKRGDWVDHRQFGLCFVEAEGNGEIRIRLPNSTRKVLRTEVFDIPPPRKEGDRWVFLLRPRLKS